MSVSADGMGISGVYSEEFRFSVPLSEHPAYNSEFAGGSPVYLYRVYEHNEKAAPSFYISYKYADDTAVTVICYDRMSFTEADFPCTDEDFLDLKGRKTGMELDRVMGRICTECGFAAYELNDNSLPENVCPISESMLAGRSCHEVLRVLANAFCGYWCCRSQGSLSVLMFVPFGKNTEELDIKIISSEFHEKLRDTSRLEISGVYMTDNSNEYGTPGDSGVIRIESPLASAALRNEINSRAAVVYTGFDCRNAFLDDLPELPLAVNFKGTNDLQSVNYCTVKISSCGILSSLGRNKVDEGKWIYKNRTRREIEKRYAEGDIWKNVELTKKDGIKHVYVNENGSKEKYGYETCGEGVTVYGGDMIDKAPAEDLTPEFDDDDNAKTVTYFKDGVKTVLEFEWDGDNIKSYKRKKYKVDPDTGEETLIFEDNTV